jgi:23S rRNA pseudouridine1911/1915/1917 synthase
VTALSRTLTADRGDAGQRLDLVLRRHLHDLRHATRTRLQGWIVDGRVTVNGIAVRRTSARTAFGDLVIVELPDAARRRATLAEQKTLSVLYEDEHLLVVDKPAGMVAHPTYKHDGGTLLNALLWLARDWPAGTRPSLIGRLDKLTSGVVLVARSAATHARLQRIMSSPDSEKDYLAVVYGRVNEQGGRINLPLGRDQQDLRRVAVSRTAGASSVTLFERLASVGSLSLLRCRLVTGRRHQIRVHLAARGWPIVGDPTYGDSRVSAIDDPTLSIAAVFPRQALHSWRVAFAHPFTGARVEVEAPIPADLQKLLTASHFSL